MKKVAVATRCLQSHCIINAQTVSVSLQSLPHLTDIDKVSFAKILGISIRTLQQRLYNDGCCFKHLLLEERKRRCFMALQDRKCSAKVLSVHLGYDNTHSFYRAFRAWAGMGLREWRALNPPCGRTLSDNELRQYP